MSGGFLEHKDSDIMLSPLPDNKDNSRRGKGSRSELSKITDIKRRIEHLGWDDGIIAYECANAQNNGFAFIKQKRGKPIY